MDPMQALGLLDRVTAMMSLPRQDHAAVATALQVLQRSLEELSTVKAELTAFKAAQPKAEA